MATLKRNIDNAVDSGDPTAADATNQSYLQSIGLTKDQWLAVANAYRGSKDNSLSQLPKDVDVTTGAPMQWRVALASTSNPADKMVMLQKLLQQNGLNPRSVQPFGKNNFAYQGPNGPMLFDEVTRDPLLGVLPVPTLRDVVESVPTAARGVGMMGGAALTADTGPGVVGGAAVGSELVGGPIEALYRLLGGVQGPGAVADVRNAVDQMGEAAATQAVFSGLGAAAPIVGKMMGMVPFEKGAAKTSLGDMLAATRKAKVPASLGELLQNRALQTIENSLRQMPASANVMARADANTFGAMQRAAADMSSAFAGGRTAQTATAFNQGLMTAGKDYIARFQATRQGMDDALTQALAASPATARGVPIQNVEYTLSQMQMAAEKSATQAEVLGPVIKEAQRLVQTAQQNAAMTGGTAHVVPMQDLLTERRNFADAAGFGGPPGEYKPDTIQAFRDMWAAIRTDVQDGATLAGPDAAELNRVHDAYVTMAHDNKNFANFSQFQQWAQLSQGKTPTQWALDLASQKDAPGAIQAIRSNVRPQQWDDIVGAVAQDMGRAPSTAQSAAGGDVWSPTAFKANLDKLRGIKDQLFGNTSSSTAFDMMQNNAKLADGLSASFNSYSRAQAAGGGLMGAYSMRELGSVPIGILVGMGTHNALEGAGAAAASMITPYAAAKMLTNPNVNRVIATFVNGLSTASKMLGVNGAAKFTLDNGPKLVARMYSLQRLDQTMKDPIDEYLRALQGAGFPGADPTTYDRLSTPTATYQPRP